jgi:ABC-type branched-subunit amino acid transport system permease subunit
VDTREEGAAAGRKKGSATKNIVDPKAGERVHRGLPVAWKFLPAASIASSLLQARTAFGCCLLLLICLLAALTARADVITSLLGNVSHAVHRSGTRTNGSSTGHKRGELFRIGGLAAGVHGALSPLQHQSCPDELGADSRHYELVF